MAGNKKPNVAIRIKTLNSMPAGYLLGRTSPGVGPVELIPLSGGAGNDVGAKLVAEGSVGGPNGGKQIAELACTLQGDTFIGPNQVFYTAIAPCGLTFPSGDTNAAAYAKASVAPTTAITLYLLNNLTTYGTSGAPTGVICTVAFAANSLTGTLTWGAAAPYTIATGTILTLVTGPTFNDSTVEGLQIVFVGDYTDG